MFYKCISQTKYSLKLGNDTGICHQWADNRNSTNGKQLQASACAGQVLLELARVWSLWVLPLHKHFWILDMAFMAFTLARVKLVLAGL